MTQEFAHPTSGDSAIESLFEVTMRGYNKRQVEDYVSWLQNEVRTAQEEARLAQSTASDHERSLASARNELAAAHDSASTARPAHEEVSERLAQILRLADEEADQKRAKAAAESDTTLEAAREQAAKVLEAARSAAEGIISAARERADKEAAAAKSEAERLLVDATSSSQNTLADAESRAAAVLADADQRSQSITTLQDERLASLRDVHTDTLRRLEAVRGVLEKVLTAEADAGPPDSGIAATPLPVAGTALRAVDIAFNGSATPVKEAVVAEVPMAEEAASLDEVDPLSDSYVIETADDIVASGTADISGEGVAAGRG